MQHSTLRKIHPYLLIINRLIFFAIIGHRCFSCEFLKSLLMKEKVKRKSWMRAKRKTGEPSYRIAELISFLPKLRYTCTTGDRSLQRINFPIRVVQNAAKSLQSEMLKEGSQMSPLECFRAYTYRVTYCRVASSTSTRGDDSEYTKGHENTHHFTF